LVFRLNGVLRTSLVASAAALCIPLSLAQTATSPKARVESETKLKRASADFVENKGQWNSRAKFLARGSGLNLWVTQTGLVLDYFAREGTKRRGNVIGVNFLGANKHPVVKGDRKTNFLSQYVRPKQPVRTAASFHNVDFHNLYAGVDMRLYKQDGAPRYDMIVAPGADPSKIRMRFDGVKSASVDKDGKLNLITSIGALKQQGLFAYQIINGLKTEVPAEFKVSGTTVQFALGSYDPTKQLVIDPLIYGSYYGGDVGIDEVRAVVADADGGVFMTGNTFATDFPLTLGPYISLSGASDAFLSKFQGDAYVHNFATYFGGTGQETGKFIALDPSGNNVWIAGTTSSATFPMVGAGSFQQNLIGTTDTFLMKWTKDPNLILTPTYATYFGSANGALGEELKGFSVGQLSGSLYLAGITTGTGIPGNINAYPGALSNAFVTKLDANGQTVTWTRYVEGTARQVLGIQNGASNTAANLSNAVAPNALAVDKDENCIIAGTVVFVGGQDTAIAPTPAFVTTPGVYLNGRQLRNNDMFVKKLDTNGAVVFGALLGGADGDICAAVATDSLGNAYVTGVAASHDFPRTLGTFGQVFDDRRTVTVTKINQDASQIVYSTNLRTHSSPKGWVDPIGISVDVRGFVYVTGVIMDGTVFPAVPGDPDMPTSATTDPSTLPTTPDAIKGAYTYQGTPDVPSTDGWLIVLDDTATTEVYGTFIGGSLDEGIFPPYNDRFGDVWVIGWTDITRAYQRISSTGTITSFPQGGVTSMASLGFITPLAFKPHGETPSMPGFATVVTNYGNLDEGPRGGGSPPTLGTGRIRDGYVLRFRLNIPIIQSLTLNPATIPGGLGATSTGTITLDVPATGAGVDVNVTLSNAVAASLDPADQVQSIVVNIPANQTTGTFTVYSNVVTDPTQVDVRAEYLGNFQQARLTVVPWLQKLTLSPNTVVGGNNATGVITLSAPAPAGGVDVTLVTSDASTILFPGGDTVNVPEGQIFANFVIQTKGVDIQTNFTVSASALTVGRTQTLTLLPASLSSVSFVPGRVAGGTPSTGTVRLDGLPGPSGFFVNLSINGNPSGYSLVPTQLNFTPNDRLLTFTVNTAPELVNTSKIITANRPAQGTYTNQTKTGTLFVDANFLTNLVLNPTTVLSGQSSTGTITISNTAQAGGVVVNLSSSNPNIATVPASVTVPAGSTNATFQVTTLATATDSVVQISAIRGTTTITRNLTIKGVTFTMSANPNSVIGGATNITGTVTLALNAPAGGVLVSLTSSAPGAASVPASVLVPAGTKIATFPITTHVVAVTQNVTITGQTQPGTTASVIVQIRAISLASLTFNPTYVKGGTFTHVQVALDAPAPAGGATVNLVSSRPTILNPGPIFIPAGQTQSAVITVPVGRVNQTVAVSVTASYNNRTIAATVTVYR
jgi:hypothetical protein